MICKTCKYYEDNMGVYVCWRMNITRTGAMYENNVLVNTHCFYYQEK